MRLFRAFLSALYPEGIKCLACGRELREGEEDVCSGCRSQLKWCAELPTLSATQGFCAGLLYEGPALRMIYSLKYYDAQYAAPFLASCISVPPDWRIDEILPVPLHPKRLAERGYNQSELLAEQLSERLCVPMNTELLFRIKNTRSQTHFSAAQRAKNLNGAFVAKGCKGKTLLLVDDVRTTGSTLSECARTLLCAGAASVYAAAVCASETGL